MDLDAVKFIQFPEIKGNGSALTVYDSSSCVPFTIKRVFSIYSKNYQSRGEHAHKECQQLLICTSGKIKITCKNKTDSCVHVLASANQGILIPPMIWASQDYLEENTILTVLCSHSYDENDYIRDYKTFLEN